MKKLSYLLLLAVLPLGLVACDNGGNEKPSEDMPDTAIGQWLEDDLTTFASVNEDIVLPYAKDLFKAYKTVTTGDDGVETTKYDTNYLLYYDEDVHKIVFTLSNEDPEASKQYYDYCVSESWVSETSPMAGAYRVTQEINASHTYYIDIFTQEKEMYALGYVRAEKSFTNTNDAFAYINEDIFDFFNKEANFPTPTFTNVTKIVTKNGWFEALPYVDVKVNTTSESDLKAFKDCLTSNGYSLDKAYETSTQVNYYLTSTFKDGKDTITRTKDIMVDKTLANNSFNIRFSLSDYDYAE